MILQLTGLQAVTEQADIHGYKKTLAITFTKAHGRKGPIDSQEALQA